MITVTPQYGRETLVSERKLAGSNVVVWHAVADALPSDTRVVLVFCPSANTAKLRTGYYVGTAPVGWFEGPCAIEGKNTVTHWAELPVGPAELPAKTETGREP